MTPGTATAQAPASLQGELDDVFRTAGGVARLLASDPKWAAEAALLETSVERGRLIAERLGWQSSACCDLERIVDNAIGLASSILEALHIPEIEFYRNVEPGISLPRAVACWERALLNLLVHAGEAMKRGGVVELRAQQAEGAIEITVADNGPTIPDQDLPLLFKPHFSTRHRPSGIRLQTVAAIVRENGGRISATNRRGASGVEFRITVPG
jgi:signal transduction histidine kinase